MAKQNYNCILYDIGDKVCEKHGIYPNEILEIEVTDLRYVGIFPTLFLKFKDKELDIGHFSNLYLPAEETIDKYKDGLKYFNEVKVNVKSSTKSNITFTRKFKQDNALTAEDLKPHFVPVGTFNARPPIKEND